MKTFSTILTLVGLFFCQQWQATHQCDKLIDLLLIIDSSGSIPVQDFEEGKRAFIDITSKLNVGVEQAHVGIINFSTDIEAFAHDGVYFADLPTLEQRIKSLRYWGQGTATGNALTMAKEYCDSFCRPLNVGVPRIFAVFTDGQSNQGVPVLPAAQELKDISQGTIFAVGMGNLDANGEAELTNIASDPSTKLHISSYQDLMRITNIISTQLCNTPAFIYPGQQIDLKLKGNETRYFRMKTLQNIKKNAIFEIRVNNKIGQVSFRIFFSLIRIREKRKRFL